MSFSLQDIVPKRAVDTRLDRLADRLLAAPAPVPAACLDRFEAEAFQNVDVMMRAAMNSNYRI